MLNIIAGKWKKTILNYNKLKTRPTSMVVKKKLFDWLKNDISNSNCIDLFCGSGSLGLEALSRGCLRLTLIEKDKFNFLNLRNIKDKLFAKNIIIYNMSVYKYILKFKFKFINYDIIFIDPPYIKFDDLVLCIRSFIKFLKKNSLLYVESIFNFKILLNYFNNLNLVNFFTFNKINGVLFEII